MELKTSYQYTYFIYPFYINSNKYDNYILRLLRNKKIKLKMFEKEKDLEIYSYFSNNIREYLFPSFSFTKEKKKKLEEVDNGLKSVLLSKHTCSIFEYEIGENAQGRVGEKNEIFFKIPKVEIVCFNTGIAFLVLKTHIEGSNNFSDVLNFNYKFRDIYAEYSNLKDYDNIKIQTDMFQDMKEISDFIYDITGVSNKDSIYDQKLFTYSYTCIDSENWNEDNGFENIEKEFYKYATIMPYQYNCDFDKDIKNKILEIKNWKYTRYSFNKLGATLLASNMDIFNYTKLPYLYENQYFYTLLFSLYKKIYLNKLTDDLKNDRNIETVQKEFAQFTKEIWRKEISNNETGTTIYNNARKIFEIDELYDQVKNQYDVVYKQKNMEKGIKGDKIIITALVISLLFNLVNFIALMNVI